MTPWWKKFLFNVLLSLDQFVNTVLGGDPDETISSRIAKRRDKPGWKVLAFIIEWFDPGHLDRFIELDEGKDSMDSV